MEKQCLLSVIVPVYNAEKYLKQCLQALAEQTCNAMEVIIVNDGSKDNSGKIADDFALKYKDLFVVLHQNNQGVFKARENGLAIARGVYVGFCDSDDIPKPNMYSDMLARAVSDSADMAVCAFERVDLSTGKILATEMTRFENKTLTNEDPGFLPVVNTALWNKIIRADLLRSAVSFEKPPRVLEDMMLLCSLYPLIKKISFISTPLYLYMVHSGSAMMHVESKDLKLLHASMEQTRKCVKQNSEDNLWLEICDCMAFVHLGISVLIRLSEQPEISSQNAVKIMRKMLNESFPLWNKNRFWSWRYSFSHSHWLDKPLIALMCYKMHVMPVLIKAYNIVTKTLKIDIKW